MELDSSFIDSLTQLLPAGLDLNIIHISTPPTKCNALFAAPPNSRPQKTYCESHFLSVGASNSNDELKRSNVLVYAIEVFIYTTATLTTVFVSKADSTGYLKQIVKEATRISPLKVISTAFLSHLTKNRLRPELPLVVSLFARAQDQYLFPGSIENPGKHVLDDRALIKWWAKVLDPILRSCPGTKETTTAAYQRNDDQARTSQGYAIVPGYDKYELNSMFPASNRADAPDNKRWLGGHPLFEISHVPAAPPSCLIPNFPDDPKARFLDELNDEIVSAGSQQSPFKTGRWKSIKTMDQFWDTMQFRQECSSGRLVGFIWVLIKPLEDKKLPALDDVLSIDLQPSESAEGSRAYRQSSPLAQKSTEFEAISKKRKKRRVLKGPIKPRVPRSLLGVAASKALKPEKKSAYYDWPVEGRGSVLVSEKDYKRITELLLRLDFSPLNVAQQSTKTWIEEIRRIAKSKDVETKIIGQFETKTNTLLNGQDAPRMLVGRKRQHESSEEIVHTASPDSTQVSKAENHPPSHHNVVNVPAVNVLSTGFIRKKAKT